ncbi:MAG: hypothetical protein P1V20_24505 [Verrucomicrobiales bacterium]|nr:hypothetical protein [Verrucomicrobiales bacterium]
MRRVRFDEAIVKILKADKRYKADAYFFLRDALDYTVKELRADELVEHRHVSGRELLEGFRQFALSELGSMVGPVLRSWGLEDGKDVGHMVYNLIQVEAFGKSEDDDPGDFENWISFEEAFRKPFQTSRPVLRAAPKNSDDLLEPPGRGNKPAKTNEA